MVFFKGDKNNPSKCRQNTHKRMMNSYGYVRRSNNKAFSPRLRKSVLYRIKSGEMSKNALLDSGVKDLGAANRWSKQMSKEGNVNSKNGARGAKRKVDTPVKETLVKLAKQDPYISTSSLAAQLESETGVNVNKRTIQRELYERLPKNQRFKLKEHNNSSSEKNLEDIIDIQMGYVEAICDALRRRVFDIDDLYFEDEAPIYEGKLPRKGRKSGSSPLYGREPYMCKHYTMLSVIGFNSWVKVWLIQGSAKDQDVKDFMNKRQARPAHAPNLGGPPVYRSIPASSYLIWDRLGRSGRSLNPCKQHYNPDVIQQLTNHQIQEVKLPPKGHELNPIEMFQGCVQEDVKRWRPNTRGVMRVGPQSFEEAQTAISEALEKLKKNSQAFQGWVNKRATGKDIKKRWQHDPIAAQVK